MGVWGLVAEPLNPNQVYGRIDMNKLSYNKKDTPKWFWFWHLFIMIIALGLVYDAWFFIKVNVNLFSNLVYTELIICWVCAFITCIEQIFNCIVNILNLKIKGV